MRFSVELGLALAAVCCYRYARHTGQPRTSLFWVPDSAPATTEPPVVGVAPMWCRI